MSTLSYRTIMRRDLLDYYSQPIRERKVGRKMNMLKQCTGKNPIYIDENTIKVAENEVYLVVDKEQAQEVCGEYFTPLQVVPNYHIATRWSHYKGCKTTMPVPVIGLTHKLCVKLENDKKGMMEQGA